MTVQYGEGLIDHLHVEITPLSTACAGVYVPLPLTERVCLVRYARDGGADIDIRHVGGNDD